MSKKHGLKAQKRAQKKREKRKKRQYTAKNDRIQAVRNYERSLLEEATNRTLVRESRSEASKKEREAMSEINKMTSVQHRRHASVSAASLFEQHRNLSSSEQETKEEGE